MCHLAATAKLQLWAGICSSCGTQDMQASQGGAPAAVQESEAGFSQEKGWIR